MAASPSPSPNPKDVLLAELRDPQFAFAATTTGHVLLGEYSTPNVTGTYRFAAGDSHAILTPESGVATERIIADGNQYQRTGDGPWFDTTDGPTFGDIGSAIAAIRELRDLGSETRAGRALHHFATKDGALTAATLDLDRPDTSAFTGAIDLYADDRGTLVSVRMRAEWRQRNRTGTAEVDASSTLELAVSGERPIIKAPDDIWLRFASSRHGYTIGHPQVFTVMEAATADEPDVFGVSSSEFFIVARERQPSGATLADYATAYVDATRRDLGAEPEARGSFEITGLPPGEILEYHLKLGGQDAYVVVGLLLNGQDGFLISARALPGQEQEARSFFQTLMGTFALSE